MNWGRRAAECPPSVSIRHSGLRHRGAGRKPRCARQDRGRGDYAAARNGISAITHSTSKPICASRPSPNAALRAMRQLA